MIPDAKTNVDTDKAHWCKYLSETFGDLISFGDFVTFNDSGIRACDENNLWNCLQFSETLK
jgi:hypothetical protein